MKVMPVNPFVPVMMQQPEAGRELPPAGAADFSQMLRGALAEVNKLQQDAAEAARNLVLGEAQDVHQVMIAMEQARLAMQLTVQLRNRLVEAYQEVSRMQI
ncbi:MAG: Flagellar hook-basal body complex protein FliE [Syntrophomonadaceae bacterium]|nr:Flagellar hook-basal body complex protein FliE [Bacillota bacterium]